MKLSQIIMALLRGSPLLIVMVVAIARVEPALAQSKIEPEAERTMRAMSAYLSSLQSFAADYDVDLEYVTREAEKLQFSASGRIEVSRPDKIHMVRHGGFADMELFFDGKQITLLGTRANAYGQLEAKGTLGNALDTLRSEIGLELPGGDLLLPDVYNALMADTHSGAYWGTTRIAGVECHYLAFRGADVDWQIWISTGDKPLPMKLVITSKWVSASPQYSIRLANWNTSPSLSAGHFDFKAPAGSRRLDAVTAEIVGEPNARMSK